MVVPTKGTFAAYSPHELHHSPSGSFVSFSQPQEQQHQRSSTPSRSPFVPVRKHANNDDDARPASPASPLTARTAPTPATPAGGTRTTTTRVADRSTSAAPPSPSRSLASPATPGHNQNSHGVAGPTVHVHPASPADSRPATPTAPVIRAKVSPSATPRRKPALVGTEFADVPSPRGTGRTRAAAAGVVDERQATPVSLSSSRVLRASTRAPATTLFPTSGDEGVDGVSMGLQGLGLSTSASTVTHVRERPTMGKGGKDNVLVCVRVRPPAAKLATAAKLAADEVAWETDPESGRVANGANEFMFDSVVTGSDNEGVYEQAGRDLVLSAMEGFDAVIFAYGQTASGKTFTLSGTPANPGIIPQAVTEIFSYIRDHPEKEFLLRASYLEIYNESLKDLLAPETGALKIRQDEKKRFFVHPLREEVVTGEAQVAALLRRGEENRHTGKTDFNERSSRSHSVFQITIESRTESSSPPPSTPSRPKTPNGPRLSPSAGGGAVRMSTLSLIDLAGSEKATSQLERRSEGAFINKSLLTLEKVIASLTEESKIHVPYRDSKLTQILQPSLSGDARVAVIATMNPSPSAVEETKSTLKFATRVKKVVLKAQVHEVVDELALIHQYRAQIAHLEAELAAAQEQAAKVASVPATLLMDPNVHMLESRIDEVKALFVRSDNVEERRQSLLPPRPVSPVKLRRPSAVAEEGEDDDDDATPLEDKLDDARAELSMAKDEIKELKQRLEEAESELSSLQTFPLVAKEPESEKDRRLFKLLKENWELKVVIQNLETPGWELKRQEREFTKQLDQHVQYGEMVKAELVAERKRVAMFEKFVLQHLKMETDRITGHRRSSIAFPTHPSQPFTPLMAQSPDLAAIHPTFVDLDDPDQDVVDFDDLRFSEENMEKAEMVRSSSRLLSAE
ncbi:centromeric protein E [Pseudohyphozyma bogoriensis]|nr:centromeric protein E [Pseudohyphozyma bogoriensis]